MRKVCVVWLSRTRKHWEKTPCLSKFFWLYYRDVMIGIKTHSTSIHQFYGGKYCIIAHLVNIHRFFGNFSLELNGPLFSWKIWSQRGSSLNLGRKLGLETILGCHGPKVYPIFFWNLCNPKFRLTLAICVPLDFLDKNGLTKLHPL